MGLSMTSESNVLLFPDRIGAFVLRRGQFFYHHYTAHSAVTGIIDQSPLAGESCYSYGIAETALFLPF